MYTNIHKSQSLSLIWANQEN